MASSASRGGAERQYHQDFIARVRSVNSLPPPPIPPKLLDIPNTGLSSGQYTNPGFASRLAREQPLNIEADAELGMPLDLVGMPGVFDGDESSIQPPAQTPIVHPHDRPLLRPLGTLGKPKSADVAVSFLRRTEYIASKRGPGDAGGALRSTPAKKTGAGPPPRRQLKRPSPEVDEDAGTPTHVKRKIAQSFDAAMRDLADPTGCVRHPRRKDLRVVSSMPLLPDLDAFPDSGAYVTVKFYSAPLAGVKGSNPSSYDSRLLSCIFRPVDKTPEEEKRHKLLEEAHARDPANNPKPPPSTAYDLYLPETAAAGAGFRRKFDVDDPQREDDGLYTTAKGGAYNHGCFQFTRLRRYETSEEVEMDHMTKYDTEVLVSLDEDIASRDDGGDGGLPVSSALYYPVMQRSTIRPQRAKQIARTNRLIAHDDDAQIVDRLDVTVEDPTDEMREYMAQYKEKPRPVEEPEDEKEEEQAAEGSQQANSPAGSANRRHQSPGGAESDEQDAEGDEEE